MNSQIKIKQFFISLAKIFNSGGSIINIKNSDLSIEKSSLIENLTDKDGGVILIKVTHDNAEQIKNKKYKIFISQTLFLRNLAK